MITRCRNNGGFCSLAGIIDKLCESDQLSLALDAVGLLNDVGILVSRDIYHSLLKQCIRKRDLTDARRLRSVLIAAGFLNVPIFADQLIRLFASCGRLQDAHGTFDDVLRPTSFTWHAILSAYVKFGDATRALDLYAKMQFDGVVPDEHVLSCILTACSSSGSLQQGRMLHFQIMMTVNVHMDITLRNSLIDMYMKCSCPEDANNIFQSSTVRDRVSWGIMISGFAENGYAIVALDYFSTLQQTGVKPDKYIFSGILKACGALEDIELGRLAHDCILRAGVKPEMVICGALVNMYIKCVNLRDAYGIFQNFCEPDVVLWSSIIAAYVEQGSFSVAIKLFCQMQYKGIEPDEAIWICIIKACSSTGSIILGNLIYCGVMESVLANEVIEATLVDMYCRCGSLKEAQRVFDRMENRDVVSYVTMIRGYAECGCGIPALKLFDRMRQEGIRPCRVALMCSLKACTTIKAVENGRWMHEQIIRNGLESDIAINCSLIDLYVKCEELKEARKLFDESNSQDDALWSTMIAGYVNCSEHVSALELFDKMVQNHINLNEVVMLHVLKSCGSLGMAQLGKQVHDQILRSSGESYEDVKKGLARMYADCGKFREAHKIFGAMSNKDVVSWGAMITAYLRHGEYGLAMKAFDEMQQHGTAPNDVIFTNLLAACSQSGFSKNGHHYFKHMTQTHKLIPKSEQYNCMVDLLLRMGSFDEAEDLILSVEAAPDVILRTSFLTSCKTYGKSEVIRECYQSTHMVELPTCQVVKHMESQTI